jgi:succinoglycan biosynthesis transport protein ExoP
MIKKVAWGHWFSGVRARPKTALCMLLMSQVVAGVCWWRLPHQYRAETVVMVTANVSPVQVVKDDGSANVVLARVALLQSRLMADRVIARLGLADNAAMRESWSMIGPGGPSYEDWLVNIVSGGLVPEPHTGSYMLTVAYASPLPGFAAVFANTYADELVALTDALNTRNDQTAESALAKGVERSKAQFEQARAELAVAGREVQGFNGYAGEEWRKFLLLKAQTSRNTRAYVDVNASSEILGKGGDAGIVLDDTYLVTKQGELSALRAQRAAVVTSKGADHPLTKALDAGIRSLEEGMALYERKRRQSITASANVSRSNLGQAERDSQEARQALLGHLVKNQAFDASYEAALQRGAAYEAALTDHAMMALNRDAARSDVRVLSRAIVPEDPWFPRWYYYFPLAALAGMICAALGSALVERRDRRVRSLEDMSLLCGASLAGRIPKG